MPRSVDTDGRRRELTDATARLIAQAGIGAVSLRAVAAEAGWSTGALTHYFSGKSDLLLATLRSSLESRRKQRSAPVGADAVGELRSALVDTLPLDDESRRHWLVTVAFCAEAAGDPELAEAQRDAYRHHLMNIAGLVGRAALAEGSDTLRWAEWLIALTDGVALQALFDPESWASVRQLQSLEDELRVTGLAGVVDAEDRPLPSSS